MTSPMWELPEHLYIPVDSEGNGPADSEDVVGWSCWCGYGGCTVLPDVKELPPIKITYFLKAGEPYTSQAYVSDMPPHIGTDKHTDAPVEVEWDEVLDSWVKVG